jgi:threonine/homoserine/homoserine lactone efflux protein
LDVVWAFARGLVIGFAIAAAIGPIGLLCIRRTLADGAVVGAVSGLGAATADALYASIAAFGLTALADLLRDVRRPLGLAGGCFLMFLAIRSLRARREEMAERPPRTLASAYATTVALTLANPATILSFAAAFVGLGLAGHDTPAAAAIVLGVFSGSAAWWVILAGTVSVSRVWLTAPAQQRLAVGSSFFIGLLGVAAILASLSA